MADHDINSRPSSADGPDHPRSAGHTASVATHRLQSDDDAAEVKEQAHPPDDHDVRTFETPDDELPPLPSDDDEELSLVDPITDYQSSQIAADDASILLERDTRRKLMDMESSFLPEQEAEANYQTTKGGADDTFLFGGSPGNSQPKPATEVKHKKNKKSIADMIRESVAAQTIKEESALSTSPTPQITVASHHESDPTEASVEDEERQSRESTTTLPSSPAADAAMRNISRAVHVKGEDDRPDLDDHGTAGHGRQGSRDTIKAEDFSASNDEDLSLADVRPQSSPGPRSDEALSTFTSVSSRLLKRPSFLSRRQSSQLSTASTNRSYISDASDITLGADFALQSGGAVPSAGSSNPNLVRLPSLGSLSSAGASVNGDAMSSWSRSRASTTTVTADLDRLEEERSSPPETPRPSTSGNGAPTDTVIAQHVQNIRVPETVAREFREKHSARSPNRIDTGGTISSFRDSRRSNLTLKEQNSKIDKLTKENFDLKLKIHFLDQALQSRSDEGVREMIGKNVQLQTDLANEKKEGQALRKKMRDLEKKMKEQEEGRTKPNHRPSSAHSDRSEKMAELEEEVIFLRETVQEHEVEIERLREETMTKEIEKRKMADYVKVMSEERRASEDSGVEETIDMWKDLLQAETARREQADEDAERLREEIHKLKEAASSVTNNHVRNVYQISKRQNVSYGPRSDAGSVAGTDLNGERADSAASTLVEQLKHENAELRRDLGAQTSMLTSRNRERERLQQEIEDLKLNQRRHAGDLSAARSIAGDSIFERSVSRAGAHNRAESRMSGNTRVTQLSDAERDDYERRHATLRDELAQIKMVNQDLERELNAHLDILQNVEAENKALKEDKNLTMEDLKALQSERDEALAIVEDREEEMEDLRKEALDEIEQLEQELLQKSQDFEALQQEMKTVSESVVRLEDELDASRRKEQQLLQQLEDTEAELERTISKLRDTNSKNERLDVQLESSQGEISFLREEQEADKIKIGDLEAALSATQTTLQDERERIMEERRQREIVDSQEKDEVQKMLDELNEESGKYQEECRKLRKNLEKKEAEASQWKERLESLETNLQEALGDLNGTRSSILKDVTKLTRDLEHTLSALEHCRQDLSEKERTLRARDALLESAGVESHKLADLLEKERAARRADRNHFDQMQRSQQSLTHTIQQNDHRVNQIESARKSERRKYDAMEQQYLTALGDRNNLLLSLWNRLSTLCGADFMQRNSLINDQLPSVDVIARNLPGFNKNVNLAIKTVEVLLGGLRTRIREVERNLYKDFQTLEHAMDVRTKRIDHLEKMVEQQTRERLEAASSMNSLIANDKELRRSLSRSSSKSGYVGKTEEMAKLKNENKLLKAELQFARAQSPSRSPTKPKHSTKGSADSTNSISGVIPPGLPNARSSPPGLTSIPRRDSSSRASMAATMGLSRHHSASAAEALAAGHSRAISRDALPGLQEGGVPTHASAQYPPGIPGGNITPLAPSEQRWIHRLKELERRLKAEREARLLDRSGARKRLEESKGENEELRLMLERERMMRRESGEMDEGQDAGEQRMGVEKEG